MTVCISLRRVCFKTMSQMRDDNSRHGFALWKCEATRRCSGNCFSTSGLRRSFKQTYPHVTTLFVRFQGQTMPCFGEGLQIISRDHSKSSKNPQSACGWSFSHAQFTLKAPMFIKHRREQLKTSATIRKVFATRRSAAEKLDPIRLYRRAACKSRPKGCVTQRRKVLGS